MKKAVKNWDDSTNNLTILQLSPSERKLKSQNALKYTNAHRNTQTVKSKTSPNNTQKPLKQINYHDWNLRHEIDFEKELENVGVNPSPRIRVSKKLFLNSSSNNPSINTASPDTIDSTNIQISELWNDCEPLVQGLEHLNHALNLQNTLPNVDYSLDDSSKPPQNSTDFKKIIQNAEIVLSNATKFIKDTSNILSSTQEKCTISEKRIMYLEKQLNVMSREFKVCCLNMDKMQAQLSQLTSQSKNHEYILGQHALLINDSNSNEQIINNIKASMISEFHNKNIQ